MKESGRKPEHTAGTGGGSLEALTKRSLLENRRDWTRRGQGDSEQESGL